MSKQETEEPYFEVTIPIAGHVRLTVQAKDEQAAIAKAFEDCSGPDQDVTWEALTTFNQGNVCYCPSPWEAEAVKVDQ
jgi:hypothetical protein